MARSGMQKMKILLVMRELLEKTDEFPELKLLVDAVQCARFDGSTRNTTFESSVISYGSVKLISE